MPEIGETRTAKSLGLSGSHRRVWRVCSQCGEGSWITKTVQKRPGYTGLCHQCNASVRGGNRVKQGYRGRHSDGYVVIKLQPDDFFYPMAGRDGYVFEHRLLSLYDEHGRRWRKIFNCEVDDLDKFKDDDVLVAGTRKS